MKKILTILLPIVLIMSMSFFYNADSSNNDSTNIVKVTLDEALKNQYLSDNSTEIAPTNEIIAYFENNGVTNINFETALKNIEFTNIQMKLLDRKIEVYKKQYSNSLDEAVSARVYSNSIDTDARKKELLNWRKKLFDLENLIHDRNQQLRTIKSNFAKDYNDTLLLQNNLKDIESSLINLDKSIQTANAKLKMGLITAKDIDSLNTEKLSLTNQLNSSKRQMEVQLIKIKQTLNIDINKSIILLAIQNSYIKYDDSAIEDNIKKSIDISFDIEKQKKDLELTKLQYDIDMRYYEKSPPSEADTLETNIEDKKTAIETSKFSIESSLWNAYYNLKNLEDNLEIEKINTELSQQALTQIQLKIKLNKATKSDELNAVLSLSKQKNKLQSSINQYMYAVEDFKMQLGE